MFMAVRKSVGLFEAKTKLSELCDHVVRTRQAVTITRRGKPLVTILPAEDRPRSIMQRRRDYARRHRSDEADDAEDFEPPARARDMADFDLAD
jgi:prevent-host-death family protein